MRYVAKVLVTHKPTGQLIQPGEEVDVSHLDKETIERLVKAGVLEPKKTKSEVKGNG
jgi:hypothetical protein